MKHRRRLPLIAAAAVLALIAPLAGLANASDASSWITEVGIYPLVHENSVLEEGVTDHVRGPFLFTCDTTFVGVYSLASDPRYPHTLILTLALRTCVNYAYNQGTFGVASVAQTWVHYDELKPFPPKLTYLSIGSDLIHESSARPGWWVSDGFISGTGVPPNKFSNGYSASGTNTNDDYVAASYTHPAWVSDVVFVNVPAYQRSASAETTWTINGTYQGIDGVNRNITPIQQPVTIVRDVGVA